MQNSLIWAAIALVVEQDLPCYYLYIFVGHYQLYI